MEATLSDRIKDILPAFDVQTIEEFVDNNALIISEDQDGLKLSGSWKDVVQAYQKLRQVELI